MGALLEQDAKTTENDAAKSAAKFRTTPIRETITQVKQLPKSAIVYKCAASSFWQFRVFLEGTQRKRSTQKTDLTEALRKAKLIYASMLQSIHGDEHGKLKLSGKRTLQTVAKSLWDKQAAMITQGELNPQKNKNDQWAYEKHIKPFFKDIELKAVTADTLEQFKYHLAKQKLAKSSQKVYFTIVSKLLKEAAKKQYIHTIPLLPTVRTDEQARGYFNSTEYTRLWQTAKRLAGKSVPVYKDADIGKDGNIRAGAKPYRSVAITQDCFNLIMFMRHTGLAPISPDIQAVAV